VLPRNRQVPADLDSGGSSLLLGLHRLIGTGRLRSLPGPGGCISMNTDVPEFAQCATAGVVDSYAGLSVSPDGPQVYAGSCPGGIAAVLVTGEPASSLNSGTGVCIDAEGDAAALTSVGAWRGLDARDKPSRQERLHGELRRSRARHVCA
jgi:hypothetical protein